MIKSVNHSWAVSDKFRSKYGDVWADMDFIFNDKISANNFKTDPMNTSIGILHLGKQKLFFRYKDLINYSKTVNKLVGNSYKSPLSELFSCDIKNKTFMLNRLEIKRLQETIDDTLLTAQRGYELGSYL